MCKRALVAIFPVLAFLAGLSAQVVTAAEAARPRPLDLTYITDDFCGVVVLHPQQMVRSPAVAALLKNEDFATVFKEVGFDPLKLVEVLMLLPAPQEAPGARSGGPSFVLRFSSPVDADALAKAMLGKPWKSLQVVPVTVAGKKCYKFEAALEEPAKTEPERRDRPFVPRTITCVADSRTVLACPGGEADLKKMLTGGATKGPLLEPLRRLDVTDDLVLLMAMEPMHKQIERELARAKASPRSSPEVPLDEIALQLQIATIKLNLSDASQSSAVLQAADAAGAAKVDEQIKVFRQSAKAGISEERKRLATRAEMPEEFRKEMEGMMSVAEKLLDALTWAKSGTRVTVTLKGDKGLMGDALAKMLLAMWRPIPARPPKAGSDIPKPADTEFPKRSDNK